MNFGQQTSQSAECKQLREKISSLKNTIEALECIRAVTKIKYKTELDSLEDEVTCMSCNVILDCVG